MTDLDKAKPESVSGGGKNAGSIMTDRLPEQRRALSRQFRELAAQAAQQPRFDGRVVLYASMFDDSLAPSYTPNDLFQATRSARLIAPYRSGYLVEIAADQLSRYADIIENSVLTKDQVDISRIEAVHFFKSADVGGAARLDEFWEAAPETDTGKAFVVWPMPLRSRARTTILVPSRAALDQLIASGTVFRIEPAPTHSRRQEMNDD